MMTDNDHQMLRCFDPWQGLVISYNRRSWVNCCVYADISDVWRGDFPDLQAAWNSPWFQRLRTKVASGELKGTGCKGCIMLRQQSVPQPYTPADGTPIQIDNLALAAKHWKAGDAILKSAPAELFFTFTAACNLRCVMCSQEDIREYEKYPDLCAEHLLTQEDVIEKALRVRVSGGEPLISRECVAFIQGFARNKRFRHTCLSIVSNGLLLNNVLDVLRQLEKVELIISADGVGVAYEKVRRGGNWEKLKANIDAFLHLKQVLKKQRWGLSFNYIVMRDTLPCLPEFLEFALARDIDKVCLMGLDPTRNTFKQDIYRNPTALAAVPEWKKIIGAAVQVCASYQHTELIHTLTSLKDRLEQVREVDQSVYACADPINLLKADNIRGKRVLIWGTGGYYRQHFAEWIKDHKNMVSYLGFVDNDDSKWDSRCEGFVIHSPTEVVDLKPDMIILAVTRQFRDIIRDQIRHELGVHTTVI